MRLNCSDKVQSVTRRDHRTQLKDILITVKSRFSSDAPCRGRRISDEESTLIRLLFRVARLRAIYIILNKRSLSTGIVPSIQQE